MNTTMLHHLRDMICTELEGYAEKENLSGNTLEIVDKLTHTLKNIDKIIMSEDLRRSGGGYSRDGYRGASSYDGGESYRGGRHYVRAHYSRAEGEGDDFRGRLEKMLECAETGRERDAIRKCIAALDND